MSNFNNPWAKGGKYWPGWDENPWVKGGEKESVFYGEDGYQSGLLWDSILDTARDVEYLTKIEKDVIFEHNKVRTSPEKYIQDSLNPMLKMFNGRIISIPGIGKFKTAEGVAPLKEAILYLKTWKPDLKSGILQPSRGLSKAAMGHATYQAQSGEFGHQGYGYSNIQERIKESVDPDPNILLSPLGGENIHYSLACKSGKYIIALLLIDDNFKSRLHRSNIMDEKWTRIGVAIASHPVSSLSCVIDYTTGHIEKEK